MPSPTGRNCGWTWASSADRTFVNNASFGAYAEVVQSPAYRDDKRGTTLQMLPDLLKGHQGAHLTAQAAGTTIDAPQALLVSNDPYGMGDVAGLGRRARLDAGTLGVVAIRVDSARQAVELVRRGHGTGLTTLTAEQVTVDADAPQIPVGIDGETVMLPTPVRCTIQPRALRVVVPRNVPASPPPSRPWNGRGCGNSPPSAPSQTASPSPPAAETGSQARTHSRGRLSQRPAWILIGDRAGEHFGGCCGPMASEALWTGSAATGAELIAGPFGSSNEWATSGQAAPSPAGGYTVCHNRYNHHRPHRG